MPPSRGEPGRGNSGLGAADVYSQQSVRRSRSRLPCSSFSCRRATEVTNWPVLVQGQHRVIAGYSQRPNSLLQALSTRLPVNELLRQRPWQRLSQVQVVDVLNLLPPP